MQTKQLDHETVDQDRHSDWVGNSAAFACPVPGCGKVFIVNAGMNVHRGERKCPRCGQSRARSRGGRKGGGTASITW
jgi:hypothetical protein